MHYQLSLNEEKNHILAVSKIKMLRKFLLRKCNLPKLFSAFLLMPFPNSETKENKQLIKTKMKATFPF